MPIVEDFKPSLSLVEDSKPELSLIGDARPSMGHFGRVSVSTSVRTGKLYRSHDLYRKHQLYYGGAREIGYCPQVAIVEDYKPGNLEIEVI